jgi:hypothetical protein
VRPAAWRFCTLAGGRFGEVYEFVELRVDVHEWILIIVRGDQKNSGNVVRGKRNNYPERSG